MPQRDDRPCDDDFAELIRSAALAGAYSYWARREPTAAAGLNRLANRERAVAAALLAQNLKDASATNQISAGVRMPLIEGGRRPNGMTE